MPARVAANIASQVAANDPNCTATASNNAIMISLRSGAAGPAAVSSSDGSGGATLSTYMHWVQIGTAMCSCAQGSLTAAQITSNIAGQITANDPNCTATAGGDQGNEIPISLRAGVQGPITVSSSDGSSSATLTGFNAADVCSQLAAQINQTDWSQNGHSRFRRPLRAIRSRSPQNRVRMGTR